MEKKELEAKGVCGGLLCCCGLLCCFSWSVCCGGFLCAPLSLHCSIRFYRHFPITNRHHGHNKPIVFRVRENFSLLFICISSHLISSHLIHNITVRIHLEKATELDKKLKYSDALEEYVKACGFLFKVMS